MQASEFAVAGLGAVALALAFPKPGQAWLAPLGAAALFWATGRLPWKRAFFAGWFAGAIFFVINFSWFSYTVGSFVGVFAPAIVLIPAFVQALSFAFAAVLWRVALQRGVRALAPAAGAAAFTVLEALRSVGVVGIPFAQIGYSQTSTPLRVFAPYAGAYGVTFVVMALGAYVAYAIDSRRLRTAACAIALAIAAWIGCYAAWPARHAPQPSIRMAAIQGNVRQTLKWQPLQARDAAERYLQMAQALAPMHPQLIVLPETAIAEVLNRDAGFLGRLGTLARSMRTTIVAGSLLDAGGKQYNALYVFSPAGSLRSIYRKRQLVPFTETFPLQQYLGWLPGANLIGTLGHGHDEAVIPFDDSSFGPLICWESAFADLVHAQVARGAQVLVIATDDAWFGTTSGTYQHAQIAQMRALENGAWTLQSASTGISGIIAPDGTWTQRSAIDERTSVIGEVGKPAGSVFAHVGPGIVIAAAALLYVVCLLLGPGMQAGRRPRAPTAFQ